MTQRDNSIRYLHDLLVGACGEELIGARRGKFDAIRNALVGVPPNALTRLSVPELKKE
jgi:hypothetical protein